MKTARPVFEVNYTEPELWRQSQEDQEFKIILGFKSSWKAA